MSYDVVAARNIAACAYSSQRRCLSHARLQSAFATRVLVGRAADPFAFGIYGSHLAFFSGKQFAMIGAMFSGTECLIQEVLRITHTLHGAHFARSCFRVLLRHTLLCLHYVVRQIKNKKYVHVGDKPTQDVL